MPLLDENCNLISGIVPPPHEWSATSNRTILADLVYDVIIVHKQTTLLELCCPPPIPPQRQGDMPNGSYTLPLVELFQEDSV